MPQPAQPTLLAVPINEKDHMIGDSEAPLTLLEYGDYECPDCFHALPLVQDIRQRFGARLRFVFRHFPRNSIHPHASVAAQAVEAAGAQGKFWEMHDLLYQHQRELDLDYTRFALRLGLEMYRFESDLSTETFARRIASDYEGGVRSGVRKTPEFFINAVRYEGPPALEPLEAALREASSRGAMTS